MKGGWGNGNPEDRPSGTVNGYVWHADQTVLRVAAEGSVIKYSIELFFMIQKMNVVIMLSIPRMDKLTARLPYPIIWSCSCSWRTISIKMSSAQSTARIEWQTCGTEDDFFVTVQKRFKIDFWASKNRCKRWFIRVSAKETLNLRLWRSCVRIAPGVHPASQ